MPNARPAPSAVDRFLADAMRMNPAERERLADLPYASVEPDADLLAANEKEAARRLKEADDGKARLIPWSRARKMALGRKRPR